MLQVARDRAVCGFERSKTIWSVNFVPFWVSVTVFRSSQVNSNTFEPFGATFLLAIACVERVLHPNVFRKCDRGWSRRRPWMRSQALHRESSRSRFVRFRIDSDVSRTKFRSYPKNIFGGRTVAGLDIASIETAAIRTNVAMQICRNQIRCACR